MRKSLLNIKKKNFPFFIALYALPQGMRSNQTEFEEPGIGVTNIQEA